MKKLIVVAFAAFNVVACSNAETDTTTSTSTTDSSTNAANGVAVTPSPDTLSSLPATSGAYSPNEGDVTYRDKKVSVWRGGNWVDADNDVTLDDGVVVNRNGRVRRNDREIELKEGEVVNKTGNFFDKSGRAIENAWGETKEEAKNAGRAIKKAAKKVGEKAEDVVDGDDKP